MNYAKKLYVFLVIVTSVVVLIYAESILVPFILALLFWFLIRVIKKQLTKIKYINRLPKVVLTIFSTVLLLSFIVLVVELITKNISQLSETLPVYQANIEQVTSSINTRFNIDLASLITDYTKGFNFGSILSGIFSALTGIFGDAFTVLLYLAFLLIEEPVFPKKIRAMYSNEKKLNQVNTLIEKIDNSIGVYISVKTVVSLLTGLLSYFALLFIGIDAPFFWSFLIFILNFIPNIGSIIATFFPAAFALLQFGTFMPGLLVLTIVGSIQLVVGNFIEPRWMGNTLNISPLVVLLTLAIWGVIWGITGMLLSVPITVIMIIIMSEFPATQPVAILLSQNGQINKT